MSSAKQELIDALCQGKISRAEIRSLIKRGKRIAPPPPLVPVVEVRAGSMRVYEHSGCHGVWLPPDLLRHMGAKTGEFLYPLLGPKGEIRLLGEGRYHELLKEDDSDRAQ